MHEFLTYLITNIVKNPQDVRVEEVVEGNGYIYNIHVNPDDMGLVIGKEGRIIKSVRALAKSKAIKDGVMISVELVEPEGSTHVRGGPRNEENEAIEAEAETEEAVVEEVAPEAQEEQEETETPDAE